MNYFDYDSDIIPGKGRILISEPFLTDANFERSVILLCEHNEEGSVGFILNKPLEVKVLDLIPDIQEGDKEVFLGGPVDPGTFHFLHKNEHIKGAQKISDGIYWGGDFDSIKNLMHLDVYDETDYKYFVGYSGWDEQQLEEEINKGSWIVSDLVDPILIFHTNPADMWKIVLRSLGGRFNVYSNYPSNPRLN